MEECKAADYSNILYIRMLWKDLEPEEGKYAWIYNERYKWYIQKAKDKGLKLAFRVFFHGVDGSTVLCVRSRSHRKPNRR